MDLGRKLDEIRKKPEHIRIRYVWGAVAVSMFFMVIIWVFSMKESFKSTRTEGDSGSFSELKKQFDDQKENMPSLNNIMSQPPAESNQDSIEQMGIEELAPEMMEGQPSGGSPNPTDSRPAPNTAPENVNQ